MELLFNVEGMMCGGCENRVKTALGEIEGVKLSLLQFVVCGVLSGILMFIFEKHK